MTWASDPIDYAATTWRATVEKRLADLEARPAVAACSPVYMSPTNVTALTNDWYVEVTGIGAFIVYWQANTTRTANRGLWAQVPWRTDASTTGELRLRVQGNEPATGLLTAYTSAVALGASSSGTVQFRWFHGFEPWTTFYLTVEARRVTGTNKVYIGFPFAAFVDPRGCTTTGI